MYTPPAPPQGATVPPPPPALPDAPAGGRSRKVTLVIAALVGGAVGVAGSADALPFPERYFLLLPVGVLLAVSLHNVLTRLLGPFAGLAPVYSSLGAGPWLGATTVGGRQLVLRPLPLILYSPCMVVADRPGLRRKLWWGAFVQLLVQSAVAAALIAAGGAVAAVGWGIALITVLIHVLAPGRVTSPAWRLLRLPFGTEEDRLGEWRVDDATIAATRAAGAGRIDLVRAALAAAPPSDSPRRLTLTTMLALAEGRSAEAAHAAVDLYARSTAPSLRAGALALYAAAISDGVRAGHFPAESGLPYFAAAMDGLRAQAPAILRRSDLVAREAYFQGRLPLAAKLAARAAANAPEALSRAGALDTLAAVHAAAGRPAEAARAQARAAGLLRL
ncbi:hypothetical protein [Streptomyces sp. NRRL F-5123]|uniref:hypothetical protein n=1 Tax=Streptomyces sp. NRRL F-5123 TaxID=1463856 RepID=UPI000AEAA9C0|nr:hypothetical protein [Streptomyces sp. NRRL F-5123]